MAARIQLGGHCRLIASDGARLATLNTGVQRFTKACHHAANELQARGRNLSARMENPPPRPRLVDGVDTPTPGPMMFSMTRVDRIPEPRRAAPFPISRLACKARAEESPAVKEPDEWFRISSFKIRAYPKLETHSDKNALRCALRLNEFNPAPG